MIEDLGNDLAKLWPKGKGGRQKTKPTPEQIAEVKELARFFGQRTTQERVANALGVSTASISAWLSLKAMIPAKRLEQLRELRAKVEQWESRTGRQFGSE